MMISDTKTSRPYPALDRACAEAITRLAEAKLHTPGGVLLSVERAAIIGNIIRCHRVNSVELDRALRAAGQSRITQ